MGSAVLGGIIAALIATVVTTGILAFVRKYDGATMFSAKGTFTTAMFIVLEMIMFGIAIGALVAACGVGGTAWYAFGSYIAVRAVAVLVTGAGVISSN